MKNYCLAAFCVYINIFTGGCQNKVFSPVTGTRLTLELPSDFKVDSSIRGFRSEVDSSMIEVYEIENPYSFEALIQKRISHALSLGDDTSNFKVSTYEGYKSVQFNRYTPILNQNGLVLSFGSDEFLVDILITASSRERLKELERVVLNGKYNKNLQIKTDSLIGFTVSYKKTNHKIFKKDANTINTLEKDSLGNLVSWLNLTRMPKSSYQGLSAKEAIDITYNLYHFDKLMISTNSLVIDNSKFLWNVYVEDHVEFLEYNIIGIIQRKEFDLLVMGGVGNKDKFAEIYGIIKSIKFNTL